MVNHFSTRAYLENLPLFRGLTPLQIDRISRHTRPVRTVRGDTVVRRGDEANGFHVVICGQIKLAFVSAGGHEKVIDILGPGGSFGQPAMFMRQPHLVIAQALADSLLLHVERDAVFDEIKRDWDFAAKIIADLAHRLHELMDDLESYSMRSGTERVICFLLRHCGDALPQTGPIQVTLPAAKGVVASRLNLTQEHFSRILRELTRAGLIQVHGRTVRILDVARVTTRVGK